MSQDMTSMVTIRRCAPEQQSEILAIINAAAERYRGTIPADCWHEPYMDATALARDIDKGVSFWGAEDEAGRLAGVMGIQPIDDVTLVRHAYVHPEFQSRGIGGLLLHHLESRTDNRILIGTWADAIWAIRFYERHGYTLIPRTETPALLNRYWDISPRQVETSVVLAKPRRAVEHP
jgi:GNAT superfamily N-acetyltransferase